MVKPAPREENRSVENVLPANFWVEIRKFKLSHGSVYFMGARGKPIASLRDAEGSVKIRNGEYLGKVHITSAAISDALVLTE